MSDTTKEQEKKRDVLLFYSGKLEQQGNKNGVARKKGKSRGVLRGINKRIPLPPLFADFAGRGCQCSLPLNSPPPGERKYFPGN